MTNDERKRIVEFEQINRNILYSFGCLNPEEGHKTLLKAISEADRHIEVKLFVDEGYYSFTELSNFAETLAISTRVEIKPAKLFEVTSLVCNSTFAVVVPALSGSTSFPLSLDSLKVPLLVSATEKNRQLLIDGITGLMHSPGNWQQLRKQLDFLYKTPAVLEQLFSNSSSFKNE